MSTRFVLGTSGHVDHGKSTLVKALTGIDPDRLIEEKRRGITIELGFAPLTLPDGTRCALVDVPGHERFVGAMVAGATGLDAVLLVVAVDEAVMPQTREHLEICRLLGVRRGLIALTKCDLLESQGQELLELARADVAAMVEGSFLEGAQVLPVSARTGAGLDALRTALGELARAAPDRPAEGPGWVPVDRVFSVRGFGTVVTGTVVAGQLAVGEAVDLVPDGPQGVRIRGLQEHGSAVERLQAGQRAAINLAGVEVEQLARGMAVVAAGRARPTRRVDVQMESVRGLPEPLGGRFRALVHVGTASVTGTVRLLDREALLPGEQAMAQVALDAPLAARAGQHLLLRGFAELKGQGRTLAGGQVIDPTPRRHRRDRVAAAARVGLLAAGAVEARLAALIAESGFMPIPLQQHADRLGISPKAAERAFQLLATRGQVVVVEREERIGLDPSAHDLLVTRLATAIAEHEVAEPLAAGMPRESLRTALGLELSPRLLARLVESLLARGLAVASGELLQTPGRRASASPQASDLVGRVRSRLAAAGLGPPWVEELAGELGVAVPRLSQVLDLLQREGAVVRVKTEMWFDAAALALLQQRLLAHLESHGEIDMQGFKELVGQSRKWSIPLGEWFDERRVTLRVGDKRVKRGR